LVRDEDSGKLEWQLEQKKLSVPRSFHTAFLVSML
jgi:hypothetical protein